MNAYSSHSKAETEEEKVLCISHVCGKDLKNLEMGTFFRSQCTRREDEELPCILIEKLQAGS